MKNLSFLKGAAGRTIIFIFIAAAGTLFFQALQLDRFASEDDPNIDQPTHEFYSHEEAFHSDNNFDVITDAQGFDNYDAGISGAEQQMSSNPRNPLQIFFGVNGASAPQEAYNTTNGGLNWSLVQPSYPGGTCCDPWSAYDSNGVLYYASGVSGQYVYTSTNNGNTWGSPVLSVNGNDRNTLAVDQSNGPYKGYLYAAITPGNFARSTNGNVSWTQTYSSSNTIPGTMIAVGPNGATQGGCVIYVTNTGTSQNVTYTFHRSTNGGANFSVMSSLTVAGHVGTLNTAGRLVINNARTRPYPMIAMDNSYGPYRGRLYLVYASNVPAGNGNKPDIILQYSTDQGATWSSRITVNDNVNPELSDQWFPAIWCEKETGKLYIKWYDTREGPATYTTGVWATYSTTGGTSFAANQRISNATWTYPCPACGPNQNCYRGDYDGMTANTKTSFSIWYDPRNCNYQNMGAYFPDFAMQVTPATDSLNSNNGNITFSCSVPAVKLYSDTALFSATVTPTPGAGMLNVTFPSGNRITNFPGNVPMRITATGGVTPGTYTVRVKGEGPNGTPVHVRNVTVYVSSTVTGITNINEIPDKYSLGQNYPNPFNPETRINFSLPEQTDVKISVYNTSGKMVQVFDMKNKEAGSHYVMFNGLNLASGVYYYKMETNSFTDTRKMLLVK